MPSNKEIITEAVEQLVSTGEPIDLLLISKALDEINGEEVGTDPDYGMHYNYLYIGMSGQRMVDEMNSNWRATDAQFLAHSSAIQLRIKSNQIKELKLENGVIYYTTEEIPISGVDERTWVALQSQWGAIVGNITDQADLTEALNDKVSTSVFEALASQVSTNTDNILTLQGSVSSIADTVSGIVSQINGTSGILARLTSAETLLAKKISSEQVLEIRTINGTALEFTTDGTTWHPVSSAGQVEWGDVIGDINNQADLKLIIENIYEAISSVSVSWGNITGDITDQVDLQLVLKAITDSIATLTGHTTNTNNPHSVTKAQVGLGNVDNTADINKPVSTPQQEAIDAALGNVKFKSLTSAQYEALATKDQNTIYFINDL